MIPISDKQVHTNIGIQVQKRTPTHTQQTKQPRGSSLPYM